MIISAFNIKSRLKQQWPAISFIWLKDTEYQLPTTEELANAIRLNSVKNVSYIKVVAECEEFAEFLKTDIKRWRIHNNATLNWPFGTVFGTVHNNKAENHYWNICLTQTQIAGIEPQTDQIWSMTSKSDFFYLIEI